MIYIYRLVLGLYRLYKWYRGLCLDYTDCAEVIQSYVLGLYRLYKRWYIVMGLDITDCIVSVIEILLYNHQQYMFGWKIVLLHGQDVWQSNCFNPLIIINIFINVKWFACSISYQIVGSILLCSSLLHHSIVITALILLWCHSAHGGLCHSCLVLTEWNTNRTVASVFSGTMFHHT